MKVKSEREVTQSCPTLNDPMDCSLPGSSIHGFFQARALEWGAIAFSGFLTTHLIIPSLLIHDHLCPVHIVKRRTVIAKFVSDIHPNGSRTEVCVEIVKNIAGH